MTTAEACTLLADKTRECAAVNAELTEARAWLRAMGRTLTEVTRENDRLREYNRRERQQHADLREQILLAGEPV